MAAHIPPPVVFDNSANACLDGAYQGGHANDDTRAGRSSKRREMAVSLQGTGIITEGELGQQEIFHHQQVTSGLPLGAAMPGAPVWFGPVIAAAMAAALAPVNARLDNIDARLDNIDARFANIDARQANMTAQNQDDALSPIVNATRNVAPNFPATLGELNALTAVQQSALLTAYGRAPNPAATRESRLKQLLGIRP